MPDNTMVLNKDPSVAASFVNRFGYEYAPTQFNYEVIRYHDTQSVGAAATTAAAVDLFNTATSSRALHAQKLVGCNLWAPGKIQGGSIFVITAIELQVVYSAAWAAARVLDAQYLAEGGLVEGLYVDNKRVTSEFHVGRGLYRSGISPITFDNVATAGAGVVMGVTGNEDGEQRTPESLVQITDSNVIKLPVSYNHAVALAAAVSLRASLLGLSISKR